MQQLTSSKVYSIVLKGPAQAGLGEDDYTDISLGGFRAGASVSLADTTCLMVTLPGEAGGSQVAPRPWPAVASRSWEMPVAAEQAWMSIHPSVG